MSDTDFAAELALAERLTDVAGAAILPHFRAERLVTENKAEDGFDPVTAADRASEAAMRAVLAEAMPEDGILGEEFANSVGTSGRTWILDPIDGTRGFVSGTPTWGVLVALADATGPRIGIIDQPYTGERFIGGPEGALFRKDGAQKTIRTSTVSRLADATIFTTFPEVGSRAEGEAFHAVASQTRLTRYGCDCYAYALLAAGQIDLVIEAGLEAYDIAAPVAVIQAAGGIVTDWTGGPAHNGGRALAAATPELHAAAMSILAPFVGG